jgi:CHAT domain-containing protein
LSDIKGLPIGAEGVVLSACNTAAAEKNGMEAISGLGRAFFYAVAKSLLVSNWPVETRSTKELTTITFKLHSDEPNISRAEALRRAKLELINHLGYRGENGKMKYSYAHPIFWAPFTLVGDGVNSM